MIAFTSATQPTGTMELSIELGSSLSIVDDEVVMKCLANGQQQSRTRITLSPTSTKVAELTAPGRSCHWVCSCETGTCSKMVDWSAPERMTFGRFGANPDTIEDSCDHLRMEFQFTQQSACAGSLQFNGQNIPEFVETEINYEGSN